MLGVALCIVYGGKVVFLSTIRKESRLYRSFPSWQWYAYPKNKYEESDFLLYAYVCVTNWLVFRLKDFTWWQT